MDLKGMVRRIGMRLSGETHVGLDEFGNVSMSLALPEYARLCAAGKLFAIDMHAGTAKAPVVAMPVASPEWGLYNASSNELMVVIQAACTIKSGTQGLGIALVGAAAIGEQTLVSADYASTIKTCLDGTNKKPDVYLQNNPTLVGATPSWHVYANDPGNLIASVNIGSGLVAKIDGVLSARPSGMVAFEVVGPTGTTALFTVSFVVALLDMDRY